MNVPNFDNKWTNYKAYGKICKDNNLDPKTSMDHCPGTMSISIVNGIVGAPFSLPSGICVEPWNSSKTSNLEQLTIVIHLK